MKASRNGNRLTFEGKELEKLKIDESMDFEIVQVKEGVFMIAGEKPGERPADEKIFSYLRGKPLKNLVEGEFEKLLDREEKERLKELLAEGAVVKFRLSPKYKKAVYRLKEKEGKGKRQEGKARQGKRDSSFTEKEQEIGEFSLEKNGFMVVKNELRAKRLSEELKERIKRREVRGIKDFDGFYYIIESDLYESAAPKVLGALGNGGAEKCEELSRKLDLNRFLVKGVCELLKDEGELIEKRKEQYQAIK